MVKVCFFNQDGTVRIIRGVWLYALLSVFVAACAIPLRQPPEPNLESADGETALVVPTGDTTSLEQENEVSQSAGDADESADTTAADVAMVVTASPGPTLTATATAMASAATQTSAPQSTPQPETTVATSLAVQVPTFDVAVLDLVELDQTFLDTISIERRAISQLEMHRYLEFTDADDVVWQGELLQGDGQTVILLQPRQAGGKFAVRLSADEAVDLSNSELEASLITSLLSVELPADSGSYDLPDAEILLVRARETDAGVWTFDVRLDHPDTGWEDYTDGWHVETLDGEILGVRILAHPHVNEMPFSRSQSGIRIPEGSTEVQVRSHDLVSGYTAETVIVPISESGGGDKYEVTR